ncbi:MFS transporter [Planobispora longispora]|uniref:MFS transporter n=1 Tax=Planobispora longispora TaxID=28887 RepID=A0A8J3W4R7_9ACTN|nr:MFS transporter [Planobispora longispora]GIH75770.1 MFS transporter [Planobispora longispora]
MSALKTPPAETRRDGLPKLLTVLGVSNAVMFALYLGVGGLLVQTQIAEIDPENKVSNVALVAGVSAIFATVFNPIGGTLSDRTRSRWGRRNPWILGGAVAALATMLLMSQVSTIPMILLGWSLAQAMMNLYQAALTAIVPDRVPEERRGTASAVISVATSIGIMIGTQVAAFFVASVSLGYLVFGSAVVLGALLVVSTTHDPRPGEYEVAERPKVSLATAIRDFLSALAHRDFMWVFIGRALIILGYFMVLLFTLFIFQDYIGLPKEEAPQAVATLTIVSTLAAMVAAVVCGPLSDRLNRRKLFVTVAGVVTAVSMLLPLLWPSMTSMLIYAVIHGAAFGAYGAVDIAIVTLVLPSKGDAARDMGILNIANAGPQMIAPFIAGMIVTTFGGYGALWVIAIIVSLVGAVAVLPIRSVR